MIKINILRLRLAQINTINLGRHLAFTTSRRSGDDFAPELWTFRGENVAWLNKQGRGSFHPQRAAWTCTEWLLLGQIHSHTLTLQVCVCYSRGPAESSRKCILMPISPLLLFYSDAATCQWSCPQSFIIQTGLCPNSVSYTMQGHTQQQSLKTSPGLLWATPRNPASTMTHKMSQTMQPGKFQKALPKDVSLFCFYVQNGVRMTPAGDQEPLGQECLIYHL